ncbi:MAG: LysM peptidoglycan-binding domain-containing protein, partial [Candidatus Methylacidiphilales bacterium]
TDVAPIIIQKEESAEVQDHTNVETDTPPETNIKKGKTSKEKPQEIDLSEKPKLVKVFYVVKKGDILNDIADLFDCSVQDVKKWNKLKSNNVQRGKKLTLYVAANKTGYYKRINKLPAKQKKRLKRKD